MIRTLFQIFKTGIVTENVLGRDADNIEVLGSKLSKIIKKRFRGSLTIRQIDAGSCNGCELEIHALNNSIYNIEQYGVRFTASPRFADLLLVTGPVTLNMEIALKRTYEATPTPKLVVAVGDCGCGQGIFDENYATIGAIDKVIPVDARIKGCPPTPAALLNGILQAIS
ncbi:MAG: NADH-quinone oxidoreductase subunit B family protein [Candidatus Margulisbacteria bacterium]|nr:NADH-quinone oxidoreductase subunit B family protein [Candidatus Margulisiibacteriota bacterium]